MIKLRGAALVSKDVAESRGWGIRGDSYTVKKDIESRNNMIFQGKDNLPIQVYHQVRYAYGDI
jgi:hypothetical protein